jgi:hypothetical protein
MTAADLQEGPVILIGYEYRLHLRADTALFPPGSILTGQLRAGLGAPEVLATLSTEAGTLIRLEDSLLEILLPPNVTAGLAVGRVILDLVRTDLTPDRHLGFSLEIPVQLPITRGL